LLGRLGLRKSQYTYIIQQLTALVNRK
jgi:hypothetical protein